MINTVLDDMATTLKKLLPWLDNAYGKAYTLVSSDNYLYPAAHVAGNEYISLLPNDMLGNYLFFELEDPSTIVPLSQIRSTTKFRVNLVVWFNLENIYGIIEDKILSDDIKEDIIQALASRFYSNAFISISEIYENAENIFKRYSLKQVDTQFLMLPYYGFKFVLDIIERKVC